MQLFIEGRREGYAPNQCRKTMTCKELREYLEGYPDDMKVYLNNDNFYTFGSITASSFTETNQYEGEEDDYEEE